MSDRKPSPSEAGAVEAWITERASATPLARRAARPVTTAAATRSDPEAQHARTPLLVPLEEMQRLFVAITTHPGTLDDAICDVGEERFARFVTPGPRASAAERMGVYHHGYRARLVECLADDYPALRYALGANEFESLCHAYIRIHPSGSPSLNRYGRFMEELCRGAALPLAEFAADIAALEWSLVEVLHARAAEVLRPEVLRSIPPERWASVRLPPSDTLRVIRSRYPINDFFQAWRDDQAPAIPSPAASAVAVYRQGDDLWRMALTPAMAELLVGLVEGETLGEALARIASRITMPEERAEAERNVMTWFHAWVEGGFFARVAFPPAP